MADSQSGSGARLLWTAGWDSTFRLLTTLFVRGKPVQPYYLIDPDRKSTPNELGAMETIADALARRHPHAAGMLGKPIVSSLSDLKPDAEITGRFERLRARSHLGGQYDWLARFAKQQGLTDLELAIHVDDRAAAFLRQYVVLDGPAEDRYHRLMDDPPDEDLRLFDCFRFPIFDVTKRQMQAAARERGFLDLMELTWFCHLPTPDGKPCGRCNPCRYTIEEGLARRVPLNTRLRQHRKRIVQRIKQPLGAMARWAGLKR